jgi:hypothetical protein
VVVRRIGDCNAGGPAKHSQADYADGIRRSQFTVQPR